jgi:TatA/E family protein of Tat protein translocase
VGNFGPVEMLVIAVFALLVFGPQRLPEISRSIGRAIREFKKVSGDFNRELEMSIDEPTTRQADKDNTAKRDPNELRPGPR